MERWQKSWDGAAARGTQPGFHLAAPNINLEKHHHFLPPGATLVPLCGKSFDMTYLAQKGHDVTGVEFIDDAVAQYFEDKASKTTTGPAGETITSARVPCDAGSASPKRVAIVKDDFFDWGERTSDMFDNVFDRGSFVGRQGKCRGRERSH